jgi:hypothetical protein
MELLNHSLLLVSLDSTSLTDIVTIQPALALLLATVDEIEAGAS